LTPLILSVGADSKDILDVLLSLPDSDIYDIDPAGNSLVHAVVETRNVEQLHNILENTKVKVAVDSQNAFGATPLAIAVLFNDLNMVRALIESGADPKISTNEKMSPLHLAAVTKNSEMMRELFPKSDPNHKNIFGNTAVMEAVLATDVLTDEFLCILKLAIQHKTDFTIRNDLGKGILHLLAIKDLTQPIELLLKSGLPLDLPDKAGRTPLIEALSSGSFKTAEFLLQKDASLASNPESFGSVLHCCRNQSQDVELKLVKLVMVHMLKRNIDIHQLLDVKDGNGESCFRVLGVQTSAFLKQGMRMFQPMTTTDNITES